MQRLARVVRHVWQSPAAVRRRFTPAVLDAIETAVRRAESDHGGEVRFVIETDLSVLAVLRGCSARDRAIEVFSASRVWDTEQNNGVLVYVLWADRAVEIVADRGLNGRVTVAEWAQVSRLMETAFRAGDWSGGAVSGVDAVGRLLARHFPTGPQNPNELPDRPLLL
jgi:uncharacterized membrane protein